MKHSYSNAPSPRFPYSKNLRFVCFLIAVAAAVVAALGPAGSNPAAAVRATADSDAVTAASISSVKIKSNGKLQVTGKNFASGDRIELDGRAVADTKANKNKPSEILLSAEAGKAATGTYVVTIRSADQSRSVPFIFDNGVQNGTPKVTITVTPATVQVTKGQKVQLSAKAFDAASGELTGVAFTWTSGNPALATVDATGTVTAVGTGKVTISAAALRNQGAAEVESRDLPAGKPGVEILSRSPVVNEGGSIVLEAVVRDASGQPVPNAVVAWTSESQDIVSIDATGRAEGKTRGFATVTAKADVPTNGSASVTVTVARVENNAGSEPSSTGSVTVDNANRVYQTDLVRQVVRRGEFGKPLELFAGLTDIPGNTDGQRLAARFNGPLGISADNRQGNIYIADSVNHAIRCVGPDETVRTVAGGGGAGSADGTTGAARFKTPRGILVDPNGDLYVADTENHTIRFVNIKRQTVTTLAGAAGESGLRDGTGSAARFKNPEGLALDATGRNIVVADAGNNVVRLVTPKGEVTTIGFITNREMSQARSTTSRGFQPRAETPAFVPSPKAVSVDAYGNIYVANAGGVSIFPRVRKSYREPINLAQGGTFGKADCVSVFGTVTYVLDAADKTQAVKRVTVAPPEIGDVRPNASPLTGGGTVEVKGRNFSDETDVLLDGQPVDDLKIRSATRLEFTVPPAISSGLRTLTVQHRGGIDQSPFYYDPPDANEIPAGAITTVAGGNQVAGDGGAATKAVLADPRSVTTDALGNVFFADTLFNRVRRVDNLSKIVTTVAGTGRLGYNGDGMSATQANLSGPEAVVSDAAGNLYIADRLAGRVRRIDAVTNEITTAAGGGTPPDGVGDGPGRNARLEPRALLFDSDGRLLIIDQANQRIRRLDLATGTVSTVAGGGTPSDGIGDGGTPLAAALVEPTTMVLDKNGRLIVGDPGARRIRVIDFTTNLIQSLTLTFNNMPVFAYSLTLDSKGAVLVGSAGRLFRFDAALGSLEALDLIDAKVGNVRSVAADGFGNLYFADDGDFGTDRGPGRILRLDSTNNRLTTYAGGGDSVADGRIATQAFLMPNDCLVIPRSGELLVSDGFNNLIRKSVPFLQNPIGTVVGGGRSKNPTDIGDGGPANQSVLREPQGLAVDPLGVFFIADSGNRRIRQVTTDGRISTLAGTGEAGAGGDGGPAQRAQLAGPFGMAVDARERLLYFIDVSPGGARVRAVNLRDGILTTIAGTGMRGFSGDNGPAKTAQIGFARAVVVDGEGNIYFTDTDNHRVRRIDRKTAIITTVAGSGATGTLAGGFGGDNGPAKQALLKFPTGLAIDGDGNLFVADAGNYRIRRIDAKTGVITTAAGTGLVGFEGDGKGALSAKLGALTGVAIDGRGNLYLSDTLFGVVRVVREIAKPVGLLGGAGPR